LTHKTPKERKSSDQGRLTAIDLPLEWVLRHFGVRLFGNPEDMEPGYFALKTPKSQNVTYLWSRTAVIDFGISAFQGSAFLKSRGNGAGRFALKPPKSERRKASLSPFRHFDIQGLNSQKHDIRILEVAKCEKRLLSWPEVKTP
jgi:hypothetical protein